MTRPGLLGVPAQLLRQVRELTGGGDGTARRAVQTGRGSAHLPVRGVHRPGQEAVADAVERALQAIDGVRWAAVNPVLAEVVVAFDGDAVDLDDLAAALEGIQAAQGVPDDDFPADLPAHPADLLPIQRGVLALAADTFGIGLGVAAGLLRLPRLPAELASSVPAAESLAPVRRVLEDHPAAETASIVVNALLHGLGQGPLGLLVDGAHRMSLVTELAARRRAWLAAEHRLHPGPPSARPEPVVVEPRPAPLPPGLVETYGQRASLASVVGAGVTLAATRDPRRTADILLAGVPRAARLGVEGFASELGRGLAGRRILPVDPRVLRRLDRVDTVVVDARAVTTGSHVVRDIVVLEAGDPEPAGAAVQALFDPNEPGRRSQRDGWVLAPVTQLSGRWPRGARTRARKLAAPGTRVLALSRDGAVAALVAVAVDVSAATAEIAAAARDAGCALVVAGARSGVAAVMGADATVPGGDHLARSVRALQAEGKVVALLSSRSGAALRAADCGIGVVSDREQHPPWGADVICFHLSEAATIIDAVPLARSASRQAVACAAVGSTVGSLLALPPAPGAGRRAVTAVQLSTLAALATGTWTAARLPARRVRSDLHPPRWDTLDPSEVLARLGSGPGGLTSDQVAVRSRPVEEAARPGITSLVAAELTNPLSVILGAGAGLSAAVGSVLDAVMVAGVIGVDALLGAAQRQRTEAAIGDLASAVFAGTARVVRDGAETATNGDGLVPGDLIQVAAGEAVPADCRVVEAAGLEADESSLTGESLPVAKDPAPVEPSAAVADRRSMIYAGTAVAAGRGSAVVVATGSDTEAGQRDTGEPGPATGVQARLQALTELTVPIVLASGAGLTLNSLLRGRPVQEAVASGVSLSAAAVPEGLPFVATVAQAATARRLAGRGVLVRNPGVLEALGRVDVLCFDKTGTLTEGKLRLRVVSDGRAEESLDRLSARGRGILAAAFRASPRPSGQIMAHPTDQAIVDAALAARVHHTDGALGWRKIASLPFEPGRAYHAVIGQRADAMLLSVKGAPEVVLPRCVNWRQPSGRRTRLDQTALTRVASEVNRLARRGLRVLAVAERAASDRRDLDDRRIERLELLGFVGVADAARPSAAAPLEQLRQAGINCVMITGDHPSTARAVAAELGLLNGRRVVSGPELDELDDSQLEHIVDDVAVFARVAPADKVRIVSAFQRSGRVVAMTGDGANDAQAIRMAQIGVAFGSNATPAARDAADLVVTSEDLDALIETIIEGRAMWASVRDALALLLGGNLGEVAFTAGGALLAGKPPLTARQLLAVNLFTDLAPAMALAVRPPPTESIALAREGPETSLAGELARDVIVRAAATASGTYAAWLTGRLTGTPTRARTIALATLVGSQLGQTLVAGRRSPLVVASTVISGAGMVAIIQTPGLSQFFDSRPLGPLGWSIATTASGMATIAAVAASRIR